jgi:hypothetical protein
MRFLLRYVIRRELAWLVITATAIALGALFGHRTHV